MLAESQPTPDKPKYKPPLRQSVPHRATAIPQTTQARFSQSVAFQAVQAVSESLKRAKSAKTRAMLARALRDAVHSWDVARDALRIIQGKGLPRMEPEKRPRGRPRALPYAVLDIEPEPAAKPTPKTLPAPAVEPAPGATEKPANPTEGSRPV